MASRQWRFAVVLLLFLLVASSIAVPITRSRKIFKDQVSYPQVVAEIKKKNELLNLEGYVEKRMNLELADYSGAGANTRHEPGGHP